MTTSMSAHWADFRRDLAELIAIESVAVPGDAPPSPYGKECARALDWMLTRAEAMGLRTKNVDGYAGHAEWGEGEEYCAVLAHLDVVPAGYGWTNDPFRLTERDGCLFGRGTADDKGAALAALYCLKQLRDNGVAGNRRIRVIFGCGEECGMEDIAHYFAVEPLPIFAFTPDSEYTVCNREKGILQIKSSGVGEKGGVIRAFCAGAAVNAVPDYAEATICCTPDEWKTLTGCFSDHSHVRWESEQDGEGFVVRAYGKGSHAMCPQEGINAAAHLIRLLHAVFGDRIGTMLTMLHRNVGLECDGHTLGIACNDQPSGALTCNLSTVTLNERCAVFSMDIRYPVTADGDKILRSLQEKTRPWAMNISVIHHLPPVYLPADNRLVRMLSEAYEQVTGERAHVYATGGGTYARTLGGRGLAFGPIFPDQDDPALHKPDEYIVTERFKTHMDICYEAMRRMVTCEARKE